MVTTRPDMSGARGRGRRTRTETCSKLCMHEATNESVLANVRDRPRLQKDQKQGYCD